MVRRERLPRREVHHDRRRGGTENGTWGVLVGGVRHWLHDTLETQAGFTHLSVNLDFHGLAQDSRLNDHPLHYDLEPTGGALRVKYRLGGSPAWVGLGYAFAATRVTFDASRRNARAARRPARLESRRVHAILHVRRA